MSRWEGSSQQSRSSGRLGYARWPSVRWSAFKSLLDNEATSHEPQLVDPQQSLFARRHAERSWEDLDASLDLSEVKWRLFQSLAGQCYRPIQSAHIEVCDLS
jgi:hypothetical protein